MSLSVDVTWQSSAAIVKPRPSIPVTQASSSTTNNTAAISKPVTTLIKTSTSSLLEQRRKLFSLPAVSTMIKINLPTSADNVSALMSKDMRVLLHNASMLSTGWKLTCTGSCTLSDAAFTSLTITKAGNMLTVKKNNLARNETSLSVKSTSGSMITIVDALTNKQYGVYRGNLDFIQQQIKKIDGTYVTDFALINILPIEQYLAGIAEASDAEPIEKTKVLALLTKAYALYYVGGSSAHPSIPKGAMYNSIDDPRFFQKYVGVTWEQRSKNW